MVILKTLFAAPTDDWIRFAGFLSGIVLFIAVAELARKRANWSPEINRKLVHVLTGILIFFTPYIFESGKPLIWMAVLFIAVNIQGIRSGKLKSIHNTSRRSYGTVYYPLTFLILVVTCWQNHRVVLMLSMLILALADAVAAIVGETIRNPHTYRLGRDKKSWEGSLVMFTTSLLIVAILLPLIGSIDGWKVSWTEAAWIGVITALFATVLECLSSGGSDNLTAPLGAAFILSFMKTQPVDAKQTLILGMGLALVIAVLSYRTKILSANGSVGTFLLATLIFGVGGWMWAVPILTFFVLSSLLSKLGRTYKSRFGMMFEKADRRDIGQVLANGSVAGGAILGSYFFPHWAWFILYLGALAAVNADTWATEIGIFSKQPPRSILTFQQVEHGRSGGVSLLGLASALSGAFIIALSGWLSSSWRSELSITHGIFWIIVLAGFSASLVDSMLGASLQAQYQCPICHKVTERQTHCKGEKTLQISGLAWMNNDWVNGFCALSGVLITAIGLNIV